MNTRVHIDHKTFYRLLSTLRLFAFTSYPIFLLSGVMWLVTAMPKFLLAFTQLLSNSPHFQAYVRLTQMGVS